MEGLQERGKEIIHRSIEFSKRGEIGKALDLIDDFLADAARVRRSDWMKPESGVPLFWLRRWLPLGASGDLSYLSRVFLVMLLRCLNSQTRQSIISAVFGIEEGREASPHSSYDQFTVEVPVFIHSKEAVPDLTFPEEDPPHEVAESLLDARFVNRSCMEANGIEATNIQQ